MNLPHDGVKEKKLPEQAKGNPVYEQTPEDMPLWCCGRNCGRNSRLTVFVLSIIGIACSVFLCLSHDYFKFTSIRNDTFYDEDKKQPHPFEYATVAKVGLFYYQIDEVFVYPWPPPRERMLFRDMLQEEVQRLESDNKRNLQKQSIRSRLLQNDTIPPITVSNTSSPVAVGPTNVPTLAPSGTPSAPTVSLSPTAAPSGSGKPTVSHQPSLLPSTSNQPSISDAPSSSGSPSTIPPSGAPTVTASPSKCVPPLEPGAAIDCELESKSPTMNPTSAPTITNPNDKVADSVQLGRRLKYPNGMEQFDTVFYNAQLGSILGPVFCACAFLTGLVEYCCCLFKCSWLPTALFLYLAFMFQMFTIFLFLSDDFCKYDQECRLGVAGFGTILATILYFICQMLICCTPRPEPLFNLMKPKPKRIQKRTREEEGYYDDGEYYDDDEYYDDGQFYDEDDQYYDGDQYNDDGTYDQSRASRSQDPSMYTENTGGNRGRGVPEDQSYYTNDDGTYYTNDQGYDQGYDNQGYDNQGYDDQGYDQSYDQGYDDGTYGGQSYDDGTYGGQGYDDGTYGGQGYDDGTYGGQGYDDGTQYDDYTQGDYSRDTRGNNY